MKETLEDLIVRLEREGRRISIDASNGRVRIAMSRPDPAMPGALSCCSPQGEPVVRDHVPGGTVWLLDDELRDMAKAVDAVADERKRRKTDAAIL